jgi:hypothetical protein
MWSVGIPWDSSAANTGKKYQQAMQGVALPLSQSFSSGESFRRTLYIVRYARSLGGVRKS